MSKNTVSFKDATLASLGFGTAKNGNAYASGIILLYGDEGAYEAGIPFICFSNAVGALRALEQQEHSAELTGESGKPERPIATVSGWFKTRKVDGKFQPAQFRLESVDSIAKAEDSTL